MLQELHAKLAEDYLSLLPETIPFLAELMEGSVLLLLICMTLDFFFLLICMTLEFFFLLNS